MAFSVEIEVCLVGYILFNVIFPLSVIVPELDTVVNVPQVVGCHGFTTLDSILFL